jgi:glycosyltransferase involved in cell wall biosynthesis
VGSPGADVTICVPAYQSEGFVADTLAAVARQTHERIRVLVSVDASSDGTEAACRVFESDRRFRVFAAVSVGSATRTFSWTGYEATST